MATENEKLNAIYTKIGFSDWIDHTLGDCPVHPDTFVVVEMNDDPEDLLDPMRASDIDWHSVGDNVTKYRFKRNPK